MTRRFIVVADYRKNSVVLGTSVSFEAPIPHENITHYSQVYSWRAYRSFAVCVHNRPAESTRET
jgi:hypothetical protein